MGIFVFLLSPSTSTSMCWGASFHPLCWDKAKVICMYGKQSGRAVALAYKLLYSTRQRKREGFWSCVPSADIIFVMQLLQTVKQSWPSKKIRLFTKWEERDNYKAWNLKALLQKLKVCVSFHYVVFSSIFFLYLLKKVKILFITN